MDQYNTLTPEIISKLKEVSDHILTGDDINPEMKCLFTVHICQTW